MKHVLPAETHLLREIFHSLDTVSRQKLRRVCPLWNAVLTGADSRKTVWISFEMNPFFLLTVEDFTYVYGAVACLIKSINSSTQRLVVECMKGENMGGAVAVVRWMLGGIRLKQLIFQSLKLDWDDRFVQDYADNGDVVEEVDDGSNKVIRRLVKDLKSLPPCCTEVRLRQCEFYWYRGCRRMTAIIPNAAIQLDAADIEAQFWDLYEATQASLSRDGVNVEVMAEWIRSGSEERRTMAAQLLNDWQSRDPRLTTQYRGHEWTEENLEDVDVSQLTTITLRALTEVSASANSCEGVQPDEDNDGGELNEDIIGDEDLIDEDEVADYDGMPLAGATATFYPLPS
ncbi:uncharacterized protein LOC129600620 [Paramacrobiotus metropolitanus]|uniref:uncharacterized protein LOC129600620 n=1 Tax=Paramacrobiotus metropolitanus TaxID=2943436 RepID=UPI002445B989|nr:uncharacterized protein LOC129600620 [Paramacrobiotus metropolitanus]